MLLAGKLQQELEESLGTSFLRATPDQAAVESWMVEVYRGAWSLPVGGLLPWI